MRKEGGSGRQVFQAAPEPQVRSGPAGSHLKLRAGGECPANKSIPAQAPRRSHCFIPLGVPAFKAELEAGEGGGSCALISGQRNLARRAATKPRSRGLEPAGGAGARLPVRAAAPGLRPDTRGRTWLFSTCGPAQGLEVSASGRAREAWQERPARLSLGIRI